MKMFGNCWTSCCPSHCYECGPLESTRVSMDTGEEGGERRLMGVVETPPAARRGSDCQPLLTESEHQQRRDSYGAMGDGSGDAAASRKPLGTRLLQHLRVYKLASSAAGSGSANGTASSSDPNPQALKWSKNGKQGVLGGGKHVSFNETFLQQTRESDHRTPEQILLDQIVEEAAASMINVNGYNYVNGREFREREHFYKYLLNRMDPEVLQRKCSNRISLLKDCNFITRNRLMKFEDYSEGTVSQEDKELLRWAAEDIDEIVNSMIIETSQCEIVAPFPSWK